MEGMFALSDEQLVAIARAFADKVTEGLARDGQEIRCLPTWCATELPAEPQPALVLDVGGTNLRAARMTRKADGWHVEQGPVEARLPVVRGRPLPREQFLGTQADLLARVARGTGGAMPLGYCFSYPAESLPGGDARLIHWTKEVFVPDTEGECVGQPLLDELRRRSVPCSSVTVVNDTVASLLAGAPACGGEGLIGLIVGTGTNMAALLPARSIPKLGHPTGRAAPIPVNLESGNFHPDFLNECDETVDQASEHPGRQRFEKAVSGAYLGRLLKAACPEAPIDPEVGSQAVVGLATGSDAAPPSVSSAARAILLRSARLVAASIAGLASRLPTPAGRCRIVAEGSLFWKAPGYADAVRTTLGTILKGIGQRGIECSIVRVADANLAGAALGAQPR